MNGTKTYITSGVRADFVVTAVRTGEAGAHGISLLVIEEGTPGFTVSKRLAKMGWLSSDTAELSFVDVRVPASTSSAKRAPGSSRSRRTSSERTHRPCRAGLCGRATRSRPHRRVVPRSRDVRPCADQPADRPAHARRDGPPRRGGARLHTLGRCSRGERRDEPGHRGVLCEEHRGRSRHVGGRSSRAAARRDGLYARERSRTAVPRHAHPRHRRRHERDPDRARGQELGYTR